MDIEADETRIQEFVEHGNYHAALNIALSSLNECRRSCYQEGVNVFLQIARLLGILCMLCVALLQQRIDQ